MSSDPDPSPAPAPSTPPAAPRKSRRRLALLVLAGVLLVAAFVAPLLVWTYSSDGPRLWGFPFFYWYQLMWVFLAAILTSTAYLIIEGREHR